MPRRRLQPKPQALLQTVCMYCGELQHVSQVGHRSKLDGQMISHGACSKCYAQAISRILNEIAELSGT